MPRRPLLAVLLVAACVGLAAQARDGLPLRLTAFAVTLGGPTTPSAAGPIEVTIERWSTADEHARLMRTLAEAGPEAMLGVLRDIEPVGTIRTPGTLAWDLHYAQDDPDGDGGRHVVLATDRPVSIWETANRPRVSDYPFTFIELQLTDDGRGVGKLAVAAKIIPGRDGSILTIENFDTQPVALNQVRVAAK